MPRKGERYLSAWLRIIRTVINEYPWKNPLNKETITSKLILLKLISRK